MEWVVALIAALLGFLGGNGIDRLTLVGRLRRALDSDLNALAKLEDGQAKDALASMINRQVHEYVSQATPSEARGRRMQRSAAVFLVIGAAALLFAGLIVGVSDGRPDEAGGALILALALTGGSYLVIGLYFHREARRQLRETARALLLEDP